MEGRVLMSLARSLCNFLGITKWKVCPFSLRMLDMRPVQPLGLFEKLKIVIGGHAFEIAVVVLTLDAPCEYPLLLGHT